LKLLSDKKIVRHTPIKLDKNPYLDVEYFVARKMKLRIKKLTDNTFKVLNNVKILCKTDTVTMTNNCCPTKG
jgi:RNA-directed DNA polymerase